LLHFLGGLGGNAFYLHNNCLFTEVELTASVSVMCVRVCRSESTRRIIVYHRTV